MNKTELIQLQNTQKEMLRSFAELCDKYQIHYFVMYGTLLGTIRHHGAIPWDNDIDTVMARSEYERFMRVCSELPVQYSVRHIAYGDSTQTGLTRIIKNQTKIYVPGHEAEECEIHIDIFVLDYAKNASRLSRKLSSSLAVFLQIAKLSKYEKSWLYERFSNQKTKLFVVFIGEIFRKIFGSAQLESWARKLLVSEIPTNMYLIMEEVTQRWPVSYFESALPMEYEDLIVSVPSGYDQILRQEYGSYMEYPPQNERFTADMDKWVIEF